MQSKTATVRAYLAELPEDRRQALAKLRTLIRKTAPDAVETMHYGMPTYVLGELLCALAAQKRYMAFYLCDTAVVDAHRSRLGKLNCGKGCIRFRSLDELPLDVVTDILREVVERRRASRQGSNLG
jgi:uncharacterized protein YdhG (YjbR/CyaY superfamily)